MEAHKAQQFDDLFTEFAKEYANTEAGKRHRDFYAEGAEHGQRNFAQIEQAARDGKDVTDLVLLRLLPHVDTQGNREKGAWIHIAPAVTKDIKTWFEGAGWTKHEDWPQIAEAILRFVQRCNADPSQVSEACNEFAALPYSKGFQMGMLTPILSALRPNAFLIINNKSRSTINFFAGTDFKLALTDYPAINAAGMALIAEVAEVMKRRTQLDIRTSDLFDMFSHWLIGVKKFPLREIRYWKISPGEDAWQWNECQEKGFIGIGWDEIGDISQLTRAEFEIRRDEALAGHPEWRRNGVDQVWKFSRIEEGDRILANRGTSEVLGIGTVTGAYSFTAGAKQPHRLPVDWDDIVPRSVDEQGWRRTLIEIDREKFAEILRAPRSANQGSANTLAVNSSYSLAECAKDTGIEQVKLERWVATLHRKGQAIFYGPPGTGKTFIAEKLTAHLIGGGDGFAELVQFHPTYAYEDFMQGLRPQRIEGGLDYPLVPGRFLDFCRRAGNCTGICVLIVDEINRANLGRVFGELMYLLEYRQRAIPLAAGGNFQIPKNVRLLGTMNTADRSIALVDHALRRRFAFIQLAPDFEILRRYHQQRSPGFPVDDLITELQRLNQAINDPHYSLGISFFLVEGVGIELPEIWRMEIEPYLEEYFFDQRAKLDEFRWEKINEKLKL